MIELSVSQNENIFFSHARLTLGYIISAGYKLNSDERGHVLLINNETFSDPQKNRKGSEKDAEQLVSLLESMNYKMFEGKQFRDHTSKVCRMLCIDEEVGVWRLAVDH